MGHPPIKGAWRFRRCSIKAAALGLVLLAIVGSGQANALAMRERAASRPVSGKAGLDVIGPANAGKLRLLQTLPFGQWAPALGLNWSPDGRWLGLGVGEWLHLLDFGQWQPGAALAPAFSYHTGALSRGLAFSSDGRWLAAASQDGGLRLWSMPPGAAGDIFEPVLQLQAHRKGANAVTFSPDGQRLASGGNDAVARFWNPADGKLLGLMVGGSFAVPSIAFTPDGSLLAVVNGNQVRLRQVGSERIAGTFRSETPLFQVSFSPDGSLLAATDQANQVLLWDPATAYRTGREQYPQPRLLAGHTGNPRNFRSLVWRAAFSPDGRLLASAGGDGRVIIWDVTGGAPLAALQAHPLGATSAVFRPDGRLLATVGLDGVLRMWGVEQ